MVQPLNVACSGLQSRHSTTRNRIRADSDDEASPDQQTSKLAPHPTQVPILDLRSSPSTKCPRCAKPLPAEAGPMESPLTITTTTRPPIDPPTHSKLARTLLTPTPQEDRQSHYAASTRCSLWGHLEPMVHPTKIPTTRTLPPLPAAAHGRLHRTLLPLQHRSTSSPETTPTMQHHAGEHPHLHVHQPIIAHARATDKSRSAHIRDVSRAEPPAIVRSAAHT